MRVLISIFLLLLSSVSIGQNSFYKLYSGIGYDKGEGIIQLEDSSYVITGSSSSWAENNQAFLLAVDKSGNFLWSNSYGGAETDNGKRIMHIPGDGFLIAGISNSYSQGDFDAFLFKTDESGNQQWHKNYNKPNSWERINDAVLTSDSGVVMVGELLPEINGNSDVYIIRTDKNGDTVWTKRLGTIGDDIANSIVRKNNNFIIGGQWYIEDSSMVKGFIMEIDINGNEVWKKIISDLPGDYIINDITLGNNKLYITGYKHGSITNFSYYGVFDNNGNIINQYTEALENKNQRSNQIEFNPFYNKIVGSFQSINADTYQDNYDLFYAYFESNGLNWMNQFKSINNEGIDEVGQIIITLDGGFIGVGYSDCTGLCQYTLNGGSHIYLLKVGSDNVFPNTENITFLNQLSEYNEISEFEIVGKTFPNPIKDILNIQFKETANKYNFNLYDVFGKLIKFGELKQEDTIDFSNLQSGVYLLETENSIVRLVKE